MKRSKSRQELPADLRRLSLVLGSAEAEERLRRTSESFAALVAYRDLAARIDDEDMRHPGSGRPLEPIIRERAWGFEASTRVIAADALQSINELRDAGVLETVLLGATSLTSSAGGDIAARLRELRPEFAKAVPQLDIRLIDEAVTIAASREVRIAERKNSVDVEMIGINGERANQGFTASPGPGAGGRVGVREFFSGERRVVSAVSPSLLMEPDCHRASRMQIAHQSSDVDVYGSFVAGLATMRETSYRQARRVNEVGHSGFNVKDPFTIIVVGAVVVGAVLIAAGIYVIASGGDLNLGIFLIGAGIIFVAGGICVALGLCVFVLAILIGVAA
jgi:hypothetical protein